MLPTSCRGTCLLHFQGRKIQSRVTQIPKNGRRVCEVASTVWLEHTCVRRAQLELQNCKVQTTTCCAITLKCLAVFAESHDTFTDEGLSTLDEEDFGGLEVACSPLVPKFAGSNPAEAVGFLRVNKNPQHLGGHGCLSVVIGVCCQVEVSATN